MKKVILYIILLGFQLCACAQKPSTAQKSYCLKDWDIYSIPADPGVNKEWKLLPISEEFNYTALPDKKPEEFTHKWKDRYIHRWKGPGLTQWSRDHSSVKDGKLAIRVSRKPKTNKVLAGCISSHESFTYPLYLEVRAKISRLVMASCVWMLSADSTEEIDILEAYGSDRPDQEWYAKRLHLSHHVFIRRPFQDYQPTDDGSYYKNGTTWADDFHRIGVYWRDPWHLEYYVDGKLVRTVSGEDIIDPKDYTKGTGLSKPMHIIINKEDQNWRSDNGITPTDEELADPDRNTMYVDWIRVYKAVVKER